MLKRIRSRAVLLTLCALIPAPWALAGLGGDVTSVVADGVSLKAERRIAQLGGYERHEFVTAQGTTVREFVSPAGVVFAVAWSGPFMPDLRQLLGVHYDHYVNAPRLPGSSRSSAHIVHEDLVVHSHGHARSFAGVAFVASLLPPGVSIDELR
jgi:hypothetical protein